MGGERQGKGKGGRVVFKYYMSSVSCLTGQRLYSLCGEW
jgi:hypothetical protein